MGDPNETLPIFIDELRLYVTKNLHVALWRLQDCSIEWIWVDATCINQQDRKKSGDIRFGLWRMSIVEHTV
ncbi:hypothetical protein K469DRAFT_780175 [Zopfia rhizophila CBS 207.26]|uniref:Heterokaryon incompatibility domain-containing protein n=1 Tax=Zopfia rhizophila CBS 207.26 TaxID=1314779 RepID=A0A6A6E0I5_9PEZI|nr:hypothetical protein K469DRAFT_780175 [Zopfia rhizophila CBS 207.26]